MPNPNFTGEFSTNQMYFDLNLSECLTDKLYGMVTDIAGKATSSHTHTGYAASDHTHTNYASSDHTHSDYAASEHTHDDYATSGHVHSTYAETNHTHNNYVTTETLSGLETDLGGKLLWSGALQMNGVQSVTLSEPISSQATGIMLVFSRYDTTNNTLINDDFVSFKVDKFTVSQQLNRGHSFFLNNANFTYVGGKYLRINDNTITGFALNDQSGTNHGISYNNAQWVLRHVLGV